MRPRSILLLVIAFLAVLFAGFKLYSRDGGERAEDIRERLRAGEKAPAASPAASPGGTAGKGAVRVETFRVEPRRLEETVTVTGELKANEEVELRSQVSGKVTGIHFREGQSVRQGELLLEIDDAELQAELRRAQVRRELEAVEEQRARQLLEDDTISQGTYDQAASDLAVLDAEIDLIRVRIERTEVRAPFDGVVGLRAVSLGAYLTPAVPVATLQSLNPIKIDFSVPEKYAGRIQAGDAVEVSVAGGGPAVQGQVYAVEPKVNAETRTLSLRARAPNPGGRLLPGAFATVRATLAADEAALLVPSIALVPGLAETRVFVVENGVAQPRSVQVGARTESQVEIRSGLSAGDLVIAAGVEQVRPGDAVEVQ